MEQSRFATDISLLTSAADTAATHVTTVTLVQFIDCALVNGTAGVTATANTTQLLPLIPVHHVGCWSRLK